MTPHEDGGKNRNQVQWFGILTILAAKLSVAVLICYVIFSIISPLFDFSKDFYEESKYMLGNISFYSFTNTD